jgi:hypothetical protein
MQKPHVTLTVAAAAVGAAAAVAAAAVVAPAVAAAVAVAAVAVAHVPCSLQECRAPAGSTRRQVSPTPSLLTALRLRRCGRD